MWVELSRSNYIILWFSFRAYCMFLSRWSIWESHGDSRSNWEFQSLISGIRAWVTELGLRLSYGSGIEVAECGSSLESTRKVGEGLKANTAWARRRRKRGWGMIALVNRASMWLARGCLSCRACMLETTVCAGCTTNEHAHGAPRPGRKWLLSGMQTARLAMHSLNPSKGMMVVAWELRLCNFEFENYFLVLDSVFGPNTKHHGFIYSHDNLICC